MKSPVVMVAVALTAAIVLMTSLLIATGTRGADAIWPIAGRQATTPVAPAMK